jgi:hypothetical protein
MQEDERAEPHASGDQGEGGGGGVKIDWKIPLKLLALIFGGVLIIFASEWRPYALNDWLHFQPLINLTICALAIVEPGAACVSFYIIRKTKNLLTSIIGAIIVSVFIFILDLALTVVLIG